MGSFNLTCALSHAPIGYCDDVQLLFLVSPKITKSSRSDEVQQIGNGSYHESYGLYQVLGGVSVPAKYEDCGEFVFDGTRTEKYILDLIQGIADKPVKNMKDVIARCADGEMYISAEPNCYKQYIVIMPMLNTIYQTLLEQKKYASGWDGQNKGGWRSIEDFKKKHFRENQPLYGDQLDITQHPNYQAQYESIQRIFPAWKHEKIHELVESLLVDNSSYLMLDKTPHFEYVYKELNPYFEIEKFSKMKLREDIPYEELCKEAIEVQYMSLVMDELGIEFKPSMINGQDKSTVPVQLWHKAVYSALINDSQNDDVLPCTFEVLCTNTLNLSDIISTQEDWWSNLVPPEVQDIIEEIRKNAGTQKRWIIPEVLAKEDSYRAAFAELGFEYHYGEVHFIVDC